MRGHRSESAFLSFSIFGWAKGPGSGAIRARVWDSEGPPGVPKGVPRDWSGSEGKLGSVGRWMRRGNNTLRAHTPQPPLPGKLEGVDLPSFVSGSARCSSFRASRRACGDPGALGSEVVTIAAALCPLHLALGLSRTSGT